jgi:hypothetical protein
VENTWTLKPAAENLREYVKRNRMELEMFLNGKFVDSISITERDLGRIYEQQHRMEKKHCHELEYSDGQLQFYVSGLSEENAKQCIP